MTGLPDRAELLAAIRVVQIPMRVRFRGVDVREVALLHGPVGWGEFGPFLEYGVAESAPWLAAAIEAGWVGWPAPRRTQVAVNATVPALDAALVPEVLARYDGSRTAKVKVAERGQSLADDVRRVAAVREVLGPGAQVRVDANGAWSVGDALVAAQALSPYRLEYVEQPCATVPELAQLRKTLSDNGINVRIAADESIRKASDPLEVARAGAADLVVVKVAPLGGVRRALAVADACGLPAVVSSALDTSVGIAAGVALAAALPELEFACGLGTVELMAADVAVPSLVPRGGLLDVGPATVDEALVEALAAPPDRQAWWRDRADAAYDVLAARRTVATAGDPAC